MRMVIFFVWSACVLFGLIPSTTAQDALLPYPDDLPRPERVLVISLDGARPDAILEANTPNIQALAERGAVTWQASTIYPSVTVPAHASMLTGLSPDEHGVVWNDYSVVILETLTFITRAHEAGYRAGMVVGKEKFKQFHQNEEIAYAFPRLGDRSVVDDAVRLLEAGYEVLFVHFPNPDYFGHLIGWMSDTYINEFANTDRQVGRLLTALDDLGLTDSTLVILTADHGGTEQSHGRDIPEHMHIPWIIAGPGIEAGIELQQPVIVTDTAMTVLWALGLDLPESDTGKPVYEAYGLTVPADAD
jgi:predicted AlkP superfamily pyrophosphatase or phosphodiesterase